MWLQANRHTTVTKFEQDVLDHLSHLPLKYAKNTTEPETGLEVDMLVTQYKSSPVKIAVEVNGVYHYSRNAEDPLGKDVIKKRVLEQRGYKVMVIPYFEWYILEEA
jgi:hypothetical protein